MVRRANGRLTGGLIGILGGFALSPLSVPAAGYFSALESKISLIDGAPVVNAGAVADEIQYVDTSNPGRNRVLPLSNSVIGPPSNLAYSARSGWLLVADSVAVDTGRVAPNDLVWAVPFGGDGFGSIQRVLAGAQPSGLDLDLQGESALVANRKDGTLTALRLSKRRWLVEQTLAVGSKDAEPTDVTISPDGLQAAYALRQARAIGFLRRESLDAPWHDVGQPLPVPGLPYRVVFAPDGQRAYTNLAATDGGHGTLQILVDDNQKWRRGGVIDLGYPDPETVEISADGRWLVLPMMAGSNLSPETEGYDHQGRILIYEVTQAPRLFQTLRCGAVPEGAAFSADALELVVQGHVDRELWIYRRSTLTEPFKIAERMAVNGHPSALIPTHEKAP